MFYYVGSSLINIKNTIAHYGAMVFLVRIMGLEPTRKQYPQESETCASANSATSAYKFFKPDFVCKANNRKYINIINLKSQSE